MKQPSVNESGAHTDSAARSTFATRRRVLAGISGAALLAGTGWWSQRWQYIIIHHSAGTYGNLAFLQKVHRERQPHDPIDAMPYHYVIGNGNGMVLGEVAQDWRTDMHIWGTHVSARNRDRNFRGLGICLIGNFDQHPVPALQYQALRNLVSTLMQQYGIRAENVSGHGHTRGEQTRCPGKYFPMERLLAELAQLEPQQRHRRA